VRYAFAVTAFLLFGCVAQGPKYQSAGVTPARGEGVIYVYRPKGNWVVRGENPYVQIGDDGLGALRSGGFVSKAVSAGEYKVVVRQSLLMMPIWSDSVEVTVADGGSAYVKVDQRYTKFGADSGLSARQEIFIEEVDSLTGQAEIAETRRNN
jgi:Protein of unknown function (DUF2846)